jgi:large subunit ribosomal protein L16
MQLIPRRTKRVKTFKPSLKKKMENRSISLEYGTYGLKIVGGSSSVKITEKQLMACINVLRKNLKGKGTFWLMSRASFLLTSKPNESRMGKGKGKGDHWVSVNGPGKVLFEISLNKKRFGSLIKIIEKRVKERVPFDLELVELRT